MAVVVAVGVMMVADQALGGFRPRESTMLMFALTSFS